MKFATSRRRFMVTLGGALLALASGRVPGARAATRIRNTAALDQLLASPSVKVLGEACLQVRACERAARRLAADGNVPQGSELAQRIRDEFERGDVVNVDGWILSRTEATVYAWAALTA